MKGKNSIGFFLKRRETESNLICLNFYVTSPGFARCIGFTYRFASLRFSERGVTCHFGPYSFVILYNIQIKTDCPSLTDRSTIHPLFTLNNFLCVRKSRCDPLKPSKLSQSLLNVLTHLIMVITKNYIEQLDDLLYHIVLKFLKKSTFT